MVTTRVDLLWKSAVLPQRTNCPPPRWNWKLLCCPNKEERSIIEKEMRFNFERVFYIVDSIWDCIEHDQHARPALVLRCMKGSEIIGEIQAATNGDVFCWAWISGHNNRTDGLTCGRTPDELNKESHWWNGPSVLYQPVQNYRGLKCGLQKEEPLPGGKMICSTATVTTHPAFIHYERFIDINRIIWVNSGKIEKHC